MRLLIMGPPGVGKGTQAALIAHHFGIPAISTGDMFRAMGSRTTPVARRIQTIMAEGGYVSDDITNAVVAERLAQPDCSNGFLLDGYPRTPQQADTLDTLLASSGSSIDAVISLNADRDELVARLLRRAELNGRTDDNEDTIRTRLQVYTDQTAPLLDVYHTRGVLISVDGLGEIGEVTERALAALETHTPDPRNASN